MRAARLAFLPVFLGAAVLLGCDKEPAKPGGSSGSGSASAASEAAKAPTVTPPAPPAPLQIAVDDTAAFVAGERFDLAAPDPKGRLVAALSGKKVEGETVRVNAARDAKIPKVATVLSALAAKKAKAIELHTPLRDRSAAQLLFALGVKPEPCSAVGFIGKDNAITTWPASGATAERFTHGMAGPDLTRGSEGIRKRLLACESPSWFISADDAITWGVTFDLAYAVMHPDDGGLPKPRAVALLTKAPVSGRKVEVEAE